jgi:hypothetical protein
LRERAGVRGIQKEPFKISGYYHPHPPSPIKGEEEDGGFRVETGL